jgi:hypothetical protein
MDILKPLFNRLRIAAGYAPMIVTTTDAQEATWLIDRERTYVRPAIVMHRKWAETTKGEKGAPEQRLWTVFDEYSGHRYFERKQENMTFKDALATLEGYEVYQANKAGITGSNDEVIAARKPFVPVTNVLRFART